MAAEALSKLHLGSKNDDASSELQTSTLENSPAAEAMTKFTCGTEQFSLTTDQLVNIPYLEALAAENFKISKGVDGAIRLDTTICKPVLMKAIIGYIQRKRGRCLLHAELLKTNLGLNDVFVLLDYLGVAKPTTSFDELNKQLKDINNCDGDKHGYGQLKANRPLARDACAVICWKGTDFVDGYREQSKMDNIILFIVSHPRTFYFYIRRLVLSWFQTSFTPTQKQIASMEKWVGQEDKLGLDANRDDSSSGSAVSPVDSYYYDSDSD